MVLRRLKLVNYGGIMNGMHLYEINIDFTRCKNRLLIIRGDNGSGKSTIEGALKPLPDDNSCFIQGKSALKEIDYFDEFTGIIYSIRFIHECKPDGTRANTKGYIQKVLPNGEVNELNPSGNISSCKDIIFDEFQLDPNYVTLMQLSSTKRGLADMRPADRKRYVNSILNTTEVYNEMYKKLSKKANSIKTLMSSITAKLGTIGDPARLQTELGIVQSKIDELGKLNKSASTDMAVAKGALKELDPDGSIINTITNIQIDTKEYLEKRNYLTSALNIGHNDINIESIERSIRLLNKNIDDLKDKIVVCNESIKSNNNQIEKIMSENEITATELQTKSNKYQNINSGLSIEQLLTMRKNGKDRINIICNRWSNLVPDMNNMSRNEIVVLIDTIKKIHNDINNMECFIEYDEFRNIVCGVYNGTLSVNNNIDEDRKIAQYTADLNRIEEEIIKVTSLKNATAILDERPLDCTIDTCPLIKKALEINNQLSNMKSIEYLVDRKQKLINDIDIMKGIKENNERINNFINIAHNAINSINGIKSILSNTSLINNDFTIIDLIMLMCKSSVNNGELYDKLYRLLDFSNDFEEFKTLTRELYQIDNDINNLSAQKDLIDILIEDMKRLNHKIDDNQKVISDLRSKVFMNTENKGTYELELEQLQKNSEKFGMLLETLSMIDDLTNELSKYKSKIDKIERYKEVITKSAKTIDYTNSELDPLVKRRDSINYNLNMYEQYNKELNEYKNSYSKIETLKNYASPTTGIQLIFANIYMNKIMDKANNLIMNLFNGQFALLPFIINDAEFRIPVAVNNGINHADITNMSSAQISLISMIISISLLSQTSTRLNIIVGDEIDAPFDFANRREFLNTLYKLMDLVQASQCVLISHNSEIDLCNCDVIVLKTDEIVKDGNVIWDYRHLS